MRSSLQENLTIKLLFLVLIEFCKLAIDYINNGINEKKCTAASSKFCSHLKKNTNIKSKCSRKPRNNLRHGKILRRSAGLPADRLYQASHHRGGLPVTGHAQLLPGADRNPVAVRQQQTRPGGIRPQAVRGQRAALS